MIIDIERIHIDNTEVLGTAVKVTAVLSEDESATTVTLSIENPYSTDVISDVTMEEEASRVFSYTWQSADSGNINYAGIYEAIVKVQNGAHRTIGYQRFNLIDIID